MTHQVHRQTTHRTWARSLGHGDHSNKEAHQPGTFNRTLLSCVQRAPLLDPHTLCCTGVVFTNSQKANHCRTITFTTCDKRFAHVVTPLIYSNVLPSFETIRKKTQCSWTEIPDTFIKKHTHRSEILWLFAYIHHWQFFIAIGRGSGSHQLKENTSPSLKRESLASVNNLRLQAARHSFWPVQLPDS